MGAGSEMKTGSATCEEGEASAVVSAKTRLDWLAMDVGCTDIEPLVSVQVTGLGLQLRESGLGVHTLSEDLGIQACGVVASSTSEGMICKYQSINFMVLNGKI